MGFRNLLLGDERRTLGLPPFAFRFGVCRVDIVHQSLDLVLPIACFGSLVDIRLQFDG